MLFLLNSKIVAETKIKTCFREGAPEPVHNFCVALGVY